jgi:subtilisin family serine protease
MEVRMFKSSFMLSAALLLFSAVHANKLNPAYLLLQINSDNELEFILNGKGDYESNNAELNQLSEKHSLQKARKLRLKHLFKGSDLYLLEFKTDYSNDTLFNDYRNCSIVVNADSISGGYRKDITTATPDDPLFSSQLAFTHMQFDDAWNINTGNNSVVVGLFDTGLDWKHPDLAENVWQNLGEDYDNDGHVLEYNSGTGEWEFDPGDINNQDDDGNGYVDDFIGWDFNDDDNDPFHENIYADSTHGTKIAGSIGAVGNNSIHAAGANWNVLILPMRVEGSYYAWVSNSIEAIDYCIGSSTDFINMSYGSSGWSSQTSFHSAIIDGNNNYNILFIGAAGNNNSSTMFYPAAWPEVLATASTGINDIKDWNSNYGSWVDCSATTDYVAYLNYNFSSNTHVSYISNGATSTAAALTSGLAALIKSANPSLTNSEIRDIIETTTDDIDAVNPSYAGLLGSGRINSHKALLLTLEYMAEDNKSNNSTPPSPTTPGTSLKPQASFMRSS